MVTAPYALLVFAGILPWTFFSNGLSEASSSLINSANLISKVYFPRLIVPTATVVRGPGGLLHQLLHSTFCSWFGTSSMPDWADPGSPRISPAGILCYRRPKPLDHGSQRQSIGIFATSSPSSCSSACMYRRLALARAWCPSNGACLYSLNPMVGVIDGFRWCILGGQSEL